MEYHCIYPHPYMLSPCGFKYGFYERGQEPAGWTDCSQLNDAELGALMMRRMKDNYRESRNG